MLRYFHFLNLLLFPQHSSLLLLRYLYTMKFTRNDELGRPDVEAYKKIDKIPVVVILDDVRSGLNVGSVFRTSDSFLISKIFLCGITSKPPERDILKSALGATESVEWEYRQSVLEIVQELKKEGYQIYAVEQSNNSIAPQDAPVSGASRFALIFGNEVKGVSTHLLPEIHGCIEIPQSGTKHSLNVSVCAGIVLWEFYRHFRLTMSGEQK